MKNPTLISNIPDTAVLEVGSSILWVNSDSGGFAAFYGADDSCRTLPVSSQEIAILEGLGRGETKAGLQKSAGCNQDQLAAFLARLAQWTPGALFWSGPQDERALERHRLLTEAARLRDMWTAMSAIEDENHLFHSEELKEADRQFDTVEATISHIFRHPHPALNGRTYGQSFCEKLITDGAFGTETRVLEVGCGLGYFTNDLLDHLQQCHAQIYDRLHYTMFDLSPELQEAQKTQCSNHLSKIEFIHGNIETYDFEGQTFDLVLSNEVVADLGVATVSVDRIDANAPETKAEYMAQKYALDCIPVKLGKHKKALINYGAIRFLETIATTLSDDGMAVLTEYGSIDLAPKAVTFENHLEFTIHFGHLKQVSQSLGLIPSLETVGEALGFDSDCETIATDGYHTLSNVILPKLGRDKIPHLAYTKQGLEAKLGPITADIGNLRYKRLDDPSAFSPFRFIVMKMRRG